MKTFGIICTLALVCGCQQLDADTENLWAKGAQSAVYPVDPGVQRSTSVSETRDTDQVAPLITNAAAYTRYAIELSTGNGQLNDENPNMAVLLAEIAEQGIPFDVAVRLASVEAADADYDDLVSHIREEARQLSTDALPRQGRQILDGYAKLSTCEAQGYARSECCQSLLWIEGFRANDTPLDDSGYHAETVATIEQLINSSDEGSEIHPFRQSGVRAWLAYCAPAITQAPKDLTEFKAHFGDYRQSQNWVREFHPISPAKQAGRRIFRRSLPDGTQVSVAESTRDDCSVLETETIVKAPNQQALFWVFQSNGIRGDYAFFPTRRPGEDAVKFVPNTCMGCHYTLDTREFTVVTPSFTALNLKLFDADGVPVWRDHTHCIEPEDNQVYHDL